MTPEARQALREAIYAHPGYLDEQPDDAEPTELTHYDCWFLPEGKDYTTHYLDETIQNNPEAVAAKCEEVFGGWLANLGLDPMPAGHFAALYRSEPDGWEGIAAAELDAVRRVLNAGYVVYEGEAGWEIFRAEDVPDLAVAPVENPLAESPRP